MNTKQILPILVLLFMTLLAGCPGEADTETATETAETAVTATATPTPTMSEAATPSPTSTPIPTTSFAIVRADDEERARRQLEAAVERWQETGQTEGRVKIASSPNQADVEVVFTPTIEYCDGERSNGTFYWCYNAPSRLSITNRYISEQTTELTRRGVGFAAGVDDPESTGGATKIDEFTLKSPFLTGGPVTVALASDNGKVTASQRESLQKTVEYWNGSSGEYGVYEGQFRVIDDVETADIRVNMVSNITTCDGKTDAVGCAPVLDRTTPARDQEVVQIERGYIQENTTAIMKHEFGHVLGLEHDDEPQPLMSATRITLFADDVTDIGERDYALESPTARVYIDYESFLADDEDIQSDINKAIDWYNAGNAEETPDNFEMLLTESRDDADIVVKRDQEACDGVYDWCASPFAANVDDDDAYEYVTNGTVYLYHGTDKTVPYDFAKGAGYVLTAPDDSDDAPPEDVSDGQQADWPE